MEEYMLTTIDNPFSPFTHFDEWRNYDETHGYYTCAYLARIAHTSDELSDDDESLSIDDAMNVIVSLNLSGKHIKIDKNYKPIVA